MTFSSIAPDLPEPKPDWPESWRLSHVYDRLELAGDRSNPGYVGAYLERANAVIDAVMRNTLVGGEILDVAGGQGNFSLRLAAQGFRVTWNDLRSELIDYIRLKSPWADKLTFAPGNVFDLGPAYYRRYDTVLAAEVIEHTAHPDRFLTQIAQFVKPGGALILTSPNGQYFRNTLPRFSDCADPSAFEEVQFKPDADGHIFLIWRDEMENFVKQSGQTMTEFRLFTNSLTAGHIKLAPLLHVLPAGVVRLIEKTTQALPKPLAKRLNSHWLAVIRKPV